MNKCEHPKALKWAECENCKKWYHQICVGVKTIGKNDVEFICNACDNFKWAWLIIE